MLAPLCIGPEKIPSDGNGEGDCFVRTTTTRRRPPSLSLFVPEACLSAKRRREREGSDQSGSSSPFGFVAGRQGVAAAMASTSSSLPGNICGRRLPTPVAWR